MNVILVVDDSQPILDLVSTLLSGTFKVVTAQNGIEALAYLSDSKVDLVLLDMNMPEMGGEETLKRLRERGNEVPVILLTGETEGSLEGGGMDFGVTHHIVNPFGPVSLLNAVTDFFRVDNRDDDSGGTIGADSGDDW